MDIIGWIISAIGGLPGLSRLLGLRRVPSLAIRPAVETIHEYRPLAYFRLTLKNDGTDSAREVMVWISKPLDAGHSITHIESQVEVVEEDSVWKGIFLRRPGERQERLWRLRTQTIHPGQEVRIAEIGVHPEWPGWAETRWTYIEWRVFSSDSAESSGKIMILVGGSAADLWAMKF